MKKNLIILISLFIMGCGGEGGNITEVLPPVVGQVQVPANATALPLLVVQVEFNDQTFTSSSLTWHQKIFGIGQSQLNDYFKEISQNNFVFIQAQEDEYSINDGLIKIHLNENHPNSRDGSFEDTAISALNAADEYINFKNYDTNTNGRIDIDELQIMFLVAGWESAASGNSPSIWAHMYCIDGVNLDTVSVMQCNNGSYTAFGEKHFNGSDATIGVIAHELGHGAFYLPDLYDTDQSTTGIGNFGLMGAGAWGYLPGQNQGTTPVHMSAWSKIESNFITPTVISVDTNNFSLDASDMTSYKALRLNTVNSDEYFLVENRSSSGYDAGLYRLDLTTFKGGLAIWHIDESKRTLNNADNTDETHRLVDLEEADIKVLDTANNEGDQSNLFNNDNNEFTIDSTPSNSDLYSGADTNINITNISVAGPTMFLDLDL